MTSILASGRLCSIALVIATATTALAEVKLHVGDVAPAFKVEEWLLPTEKGLDVNLTDGKVHVIEFWATWCGPCKFSIPHLTRLQQKWGEDRLQIIGISDEKIDVVKPWVKRNLSQIGYGIAVSGKRGVQRSWFKAAGLTGIPAAFIVGPAGRVQFIGNPNGEEFEQTLNKVMNGRFDAAKAKRLKAIEKKKAAKGKGKGDGKTKSGKGNKGDKGGGKNSKGKTPTVGGAWCMNYSNTGECKFGKDKCRYYHPSRAEKDALTPDQKKEKGIK